MNYQELERATPEEFNLYFTTFWNELGLKMAIPQGMVAAYYEKLKDFPGSFIADVFGEYLNYNASESKDIPTTAYFVSHCTSKKTAYCKQTEPEFVRTQLSETWRRCLMTGTRIMLIAKNNNLIDDAAVGIRKMQTWLDKIKVSGANDAEEQMISGIRSMARKYKAYLDPAWPGVMDMAEPVVSAGATTTMSKLGDVLEKELERV